LTYQMKPRRFARGGKPKPPAEPIHNRQSTDLLRNAQVAAVVVDDPYEPGARIAVLRSTRDDILARMEAAREIDQAQYDAGRLYQKYAEQAEIGNVQAMDPAKDKVDGGQIGSSDMTNEQVNAVRALGGARKALTPDGEYLVRRILVERASFTKIAGSERKATRLKERFFFSLEILAALWGCSTRKVRDTQREAGIPIPGGGT
jgi:hypothetical protein